MDYIWDELSDMSVSKVVRWVATAGMIFGGVVPYIPQYREIKRTEDADGFSLFVCLNLLVANTLRILFWFGRKYELPLLVQSVVMISTMFMMIHLCVGVRSKNQIVRARDRCFTDFDSRYFWAWTDFISYVDFMLVFTAACSLFMYILVDVSLFVELVGFMAVFVEALLGAPQLLQNYRKKTTAGMSVKMVAMWTTGDTFKTVYFVVRETPAQFWMCGLMQVLIDIIILAQVWWYRHSVGHRSRKQEVPD